jgi:hypothetical protein
MHLRSAHAFAHLCALALALSLLLAACGSRTAELRDAAVPTTAADNAKPAPSAVSEPATLQATTAPPTAPRTAAPEREALELEASGFGQDENELGYSFVVVNPNPTHAVTSTEYQAAFYDDAGTVIATDTGFIELLLPGQTLGLAGLQYVDEDVKAARLEVQLNDGVFEASEPLDTFSVDRVAYLDDENFPKVVAMVKSPYTKDVDDVRVAAVVYDDTGAIIGGGFTFVNFIPAGGETAIAMSITASAKPSRLELYPAITSLSELSGASESDGAMPLALDASGFGQNNTQVGFGFLVTNPNSDTALESSRYRVAAYAEDGSVLGADEGYIDVILPAQPLGVGGNISVPQGSSVANIVVQVKSGAAHEPDNALPFSTDNVVFQADEYFPKVTGVVQNPYAKAVKQVRVSTLVYDEAGEIVGGGFTFLEFVPAEGQAAAEIPVYHSGAPIKAELYPTLTSISEFEE